MTFYQQCRMILSKGDTVDAANDAEALRDACQEGVGAVDDLRSDTSASRRVSEVCQLIDTFGIEQARGVLDQLAEELGEASKDEIQKAMREYPSS